MRAETRLRDAPREDGGSGGDTGQPEVGFGCGARNGFGRVGHPWVLRPVTAPDVTAPDITDPDVLCWLGVTPGPPSRRAGCPTSAGKVQHQLQLPNPFLMGA